MRIAQNEALVLCWCSATNKGSALWFYFPERFRSRASSTSQLNNKESFLRVSSRHEAKDSKLLDAFERLSRIIILQETTIMFSSFIFKPNPKKVKEDRMADVYMFGFIALLVLIVVLLPGLKSLAFLIFVSMGLIKLKLNDIKKKGINRFGSLPYSFQISTEHIKIGPNEFRLSDLSDLEIDADDFNGGPGGDIFSASIGTDNFISFTIRGEKHEYQFLVKNQSDLKLINHLAKQVTYGRAGVV
jgi:hypothetical protein